MACPQRWFRLGVIKVNIEWSSVDILILLVRVLAVIVLIILEKGKEDNKQMDQYVIYITLFLGRQLFEFS